MKNLIPILTINGSDSSGRAGVQADIRTVTAMGGYALSAITSVTVQDAHGIQRIQNLPADIVNGQVTAVTRSNRPAAVKIGMVRDAATVRSLRDAIIGMPNLVLVPGLLTSHGERLADDGAMDEMCHSLVPEARFLVMRCSEAELLLHTTIATDDDMLHAAQRLKSMGAEAVMLREGHIVADSVTALLLDSDGHMMFSSRNTEGWKQHGIGAAFSAAVAVRLGGGDDIRTAVAKAHAFIHTQIVYAVSDSGSQRRPADIYNMFMNLVAGHYREEHSVAWYAAELTISTRYLSQITADIIGKSPKRIIDEYLTNEAKVLITTSRLTMQEIAYMLGFSSQAAFCRSFRTISGCPPSCLRT